MNRRTVQAYFRWQIDQHVHGMRATARRPELGRGRIVGNVTDAEISVTYPDGTQETWYGGRYAARKIHGCYAPLMPTLTRGE